MERKSSTKKSFSKKVSDEPSFHTPRGQESSGGYFFSQLLFKTPENQPDEKSCCVYLLSKPYRDLPIAVSVFGQDPHESRKYLHVEDAIEAAKQLYFNLESKNG
jgi:hypothetical protein